MKTINKNIIYLLTIFFLTFSAGSVSAQTAEGSGTSQETLIMIVMGLVLLVAILVLVVAIYMVMVIKSILKREEKIAAMEKGIKYIEEEKESWWTRINNKLNRSVPVEEESEVLLDHDYDGIKELDNHLPPWWKALFYFTVIVSVIYLFVYHVIPIFPLQEEEYAMELEKAEELQASLAASGSVETIDINNPEPSDDPTDISSGQSVFNINCLSCHAADGGGGIGPNLTDNYWLHGGDFQSIFDTVHEGVSGTSMIAWKNVLTPVQIRDVSSYIQTLVGTTPANPKAPEGELYEPSEMSVDQVEASADTVATETDSLQTN